MKNAIVLAALFAAAAQAQVSVVEVTRHTGAGTGNVLSRHPDLPGCLAAVAASSPVGDHMCKARVRKAATPPAPPPPAPPPPAPPPAPVGSPLPIINGCPPAVLERGTVVIPAGTVCTSRVTLTGTAPKRITGPGTLRVTSGNAVELGTYNSSTANVLIDVARIDGGGTGGWGVWLRNDSSHVVVEKTEITGFAIGMHFQGGAQSTGVVVRNNNVHSNHGMGFLGRAQGIQIVDNDFSRNNFTGSNRDHGIYLSADGVEMVGVRVADNRLLRNSVVNGVCTGGNLTVHGRYRDLVIERNVIEQDSAAMSCYGISITPAYSSTEWFRGLVVRGNTIRNTGGHSIAVSSAPGAVVENNRSINAGTIGQGIAPGAGDEDDRQDSTKVFRNNCGASIVIAGQQIGNTASCQ